MESNGHPLLDRLEGSRSKRGPFSHPVPRSGGWPECLGETIGISKNAVVASCETGLRRGSEFWELLKESDARRVTVEIDELFRKIAAGRPGGGSVSEFGFLCGRRGGSGVKRAW